MKNVLDIAFVLPWYGKDIGGGAETLCWELVHALLTYSHTVKPKVLTTTLPGFSEDWNTPRHAADRATEDGVTVHRFHPTRPRRNSFHRINGTRLMPQGTEDLWKDGRPVSPLSRLLEWYVMRAMLQAPGMYQYLRQHGHELDFGVMLPYMFGTTVSAARLLGRKAIHIPCLHNERYAYMRVYRKMLEKAGGLLFNTEAEQRLATRLADIDAVPQCVLGVIVDCDPPPGNPDAFRKKYNLSKPFILYAGRKIAGKGLPQLVAYFNQMRNGADISHPVPDLVIIGKGDLTYPAETNPGIIDLGFVSEQDKYDALAAATALCLPSIMESFSIVIMEAWLQSTPVIVPEQCEVTSDHCRACGGGWHFSDARTFGESVMAATLMGGTEEGRRGAAYVRERYAASSVVARLEAFLQDLQK